MMYPPLQHRLIRHFANWQVTPGDQCVFVGTRPIDDGWVVVIVRIDDCIDETEASWLGTRIREDLLTHMRYTNQEDVPPEAVDFEHGVPAGGVGWSVAVYVTLWSMSEAKAMVGFLTAYADTGLN